MNNIDMRTSKESGQVSIITVIVFILLFSVLVISFSRIMVIASRQAVNDELAASAKAAAESGIEDAKRVLSYCASGGTGCEMLNKPFTDASGQTCTTITSNSALMSSMQRSVVSGSSSSVKVGDSGSQEYLCLKMTMLTPDYLGSLSSNGNSDGIGESVVVPLKFANASGVATSARTIRVQWHNTNSDSNGPATLLAGSDLPPANKWGRAVPAVLRVEFVAVPKAGFTVDQLNTNTRAVTLRPSTAENAFNATKPAGIDAYNLNSWMTADTPNAVNPRINLLQVRCTAGSGSSYACSTNFTIPRIIGGSLDYLFDTTGQYDYYMRLQSIYQNTHFRLSAKDSSNNDLFFDHVQANVDVTGRASESQKRLDVRLNPNNGDQDYQWWPDYAVDTAGKVCKNMVVEAWTGADNCAD